MYDQASNQLENFLCLLSWSRGADNCFQSPMWRVITRLLTIMLVLKKTEFLSQVAYDGHEKFLQVLL